MSFYTTAYSLGISPHQMPTRQENIERLEKHYALYVGFIQLAFCCLILERLIDLFLGYALKELLFLPIQVLNCDSTILYAPVIELNGCLSHVSFIHHTQAIKSSFVHQ